MLENSMVIGRYYPDDARPEPDPDEAYDRIKQWELDERMEHEPSSDGEREGCAIMKGAHNG